MAARDGSPAFVLRAIAVEPGCERPFVEGEWLDALVSVAQGTVELECSSGARRTFGVGEVFWLTGLPVRVLRNTGSDPALLLAVSRRSVSRRRSV